MTTTIEFRRHSVKDGASGKSIGLLGYALARAVGEKQLRGKNFTDFLVSPLWRTYQTLAAFAEGAGDFRLFLAPAVAPIYVNEPRLKDMYRACKSAEKRDADLLLAAMEFDKDLVLRTAATAAVQFNEWAHQLPADSRVLVVGHSPEMEFVPLGLLNATLPSLKECEAFNICWNGSAYEIERGSPDLDPREIRR